MIDQLIVGIILMVITVVFNRAESYITKKRKERKETQKQIAVKELSKTQTDFPIYLPSGSIEPPEGAGELYYLGEHSEHYQHSAGSFGYSPIVAPSGSEDNEIKKEMEQKISILQSTAKAIEDRSPSATETEKLASVNNAILDTNIKTLSDSLKRIEDHMLSKWDVAKIVFQIILVLSGLLVIILTIIDR